MTIKRYYNLAITALIVAVTMMMGACSSAPSAEDILKTIPDNSVVVARLNANSLLTNADITRDHDKYVLSDDLDKICDELPSSVRENLEDFMAAMPAIDADNIFVFFTEREEWAMTVGLSHASEVEDALHKEFGAPEKNGDFKIYEVDRDTKVMIRDKQMWVTDDPARAIRAIERATDSPFTEYTGPCEYLTGDLTAAVVVNLKAAKKASGYWPDELEDYSKSFVVANAKLDGPALTAELSLMNADGKNTFPGDYVGEINTSFLRYVPGDAVIAGAAGRPTDALFEMFGSQLPRDVKNFLKEVDGTSAFAMVPPADISQMDYTPAWNVLFMTHLKQDKVNEYADWLAGSTGVSVNPAHQYNYTNMWGAATWGFGGQTMYFGNYDGYLTLSSMPIVSNRSNAFATAFEGKRAVLAIIAPRTCPLLSQFSLPFGMSFIASYEDDAIKAEFKLTGAEGGILENIIHLCADKKWQRRIMDSFFSHPSSSSSYDYSDYEVVEDYDDDWVEVEEAVVEEAEPDYNY